MGNHTHSHANSDDVYKEKRDSITHEAFEQGPRLLGILYVKNKGDAINPLIQQHMYKPKQVI